MIAHRNYSETRYSDGRVVIFDPLIRWHWWRGMAEIGVRGDYAIGFMWGWRVGTYTTCRTKWIEFGKLTLYVHFGKTEAHNPRSTVA